MKKIALLCAAGMSTSVLVQKMRDAAAEASFECEIGAYPVASAEEVGETADCLLLGPQVRYELDNVRAKVSCPVDVIDMFSYGTMDGKKVIEFARRLMGC